MFITFKSLVAKAMPQGQGQGLNPRGKTKVKAGRSEAEGSKIWPGDQAHSSRTISVMMTMNLHLDSAPFNATLNSDTFPSHITSKHITTSSNMQHIKYPHSVQKPDEEKSYRLACFSYI
jgi:hypothetical protein